MILPKHKIKFLITAIILFAVIFTIKRYLIDLSYIVGDSMKPTYRPYQFVFVNKASPSYDRFSIVIVDINNRLLIKRIIGLPGETIQIKNGKVYINGEIINDVCNELIDFAGTAFEPLTLADNEYFVLGDNRNNSIDSRFSEIGPITKDNLCGKVIEKSH